MPRPHATAARACLPACARTGGLLLLTLVALLALRVQPAHANYDYYKCRFDQSVTCGTVEVPVDAATPASGMVSLRVYVANRRQARHGTVLGLAGGPGQPAEVLIEGAPVQFATRRIVAFDPRGVGRSTPISCGHLGIASIQAAPDDAAVDAGIQQVADCLRSLGTATSAHYRTWDNADDIEAVRQSLHVDKLTLWGTSYGTTQALAYARRYPTHVDKLVLDSVEPLPIDFWQRLPVRSLPTILRQQCINGACRQVSAHPVADLVKVMGALHAAPVTAPIVNAVGHPARRQLTMSSFFGLLYDGDFDPTLRGALPGATAAAAGGDWTPLARLQAPRAAGGSGDDPEEFDGVSLAVNLATVCEDVTAPWPRTASTQAERLAAWRTALAALPADFYAPLPSWIGNIESDDQCIGWTQDAAQPSYDGMALPDVPTFIVGGDVDVRTPLAGDQTILDAQPRATLVRSHLSGHSVLGDSTCAGVKLDAFMRGRKLHRIEHCSSDYGVFGATQATPRLHLSQVTPLAGTHGAPGRVAGAVRATLDDSLLQVVHGLLSSSGGDAAVAVSTPGNGVNPLRPRVRAALAKAKAVGQRVQIVPGLRRGRTEVRVDPFGFTYRNLQWLPGLRVDGNLALPSPKNAEHLAESKDPLAVAKATVVHGSISVTGPGGVRGYLRARGTGYAFRWVGRIAGQPVVIPGSPVAMLL